MIYIFTAIVGLGLWGLLLWPLFRKAEGPLQVGWNSQDVGELLGQKDILITDFLALEKALDQDQVTQTEFRKRKEFLLNRYIDLCRRVEFLEIRKKNG